MFLGNSSIYQDPWEPFEKQEWNSKGKMATSISRKVWLNLLLLNPFYHSDYQSIDTRCHQSAERGLGWENVYLDIESFVFYLVSSIDRSEYNLSRVMAENIQITITINLSKKTCLLLYRLFLPFSLASFCATHLYYRCYRLSEWKWDGIKWDKFRSSTS